MDVPEMATRTTARTTGKSTASRRLARDTSMAAREGSRSQRMDLVKLLASV